MIMEAIICPHCKSEDVTKYGLTSDGKQRYECKNKNCHAKTFIRNYSYKGRIPEVKKQIIEMSMNASGIRDISRVQNVSPVTVIKELKKRIVNPTSKYQCN